VYLIPQQISSMGNFTSGVPEINWDGIEVTDRMRQILAAPENISLETIFCEIFDEDEDLMDVFISNNGIVFDRNRGTFIEPLQRQ
jgi:hypothetical protein